MASNTYQPTYLPIASAAPTPTAGEAPSSQATLPPEHVTLPSGTEVDTEAQSPVVSPSVNEVPPSLVRTFTTSSALWSPRPFDNSAYSTLRLSFTGNKKHTMQATVLDMDSQTVYYKFAGNSDATEMRDRDDKIIARFEWHTFTANKLDYKLHKYDIKNWIPLSKKKRRTVTHNGRDYEWVAIDNVHVLQIVGMPGHNAAIWDNHKGVVNVEILPEGLLLDLIEPIVLSIAILESGHSIGEGDATGTIGGGGSSSGFLGSVEEGAGESIGTSAMNAILGTGN